MNNVVDINTEKQARITEERLVKQILELKHAGFNQKVTIDGEQVLYSRHNLIDEAQRHTHSRGAEKGILTFLPSVSQGAVLKDLVKIREISADTLYKWIHERMQEMLETFQCEESAQNWNTTEQGEFFTDLIELTEVHIERQPCYFGGARQWFSCPKCGRRAAKLYGRKYFLCRQCQDLNYASQRDSFGSLCDRVRVMEKRLCKKGSHVSTRMKVLDKLQGLRLRQRSHMQLFFERHDKRLKRLERKLD